MLGAVVTAAIVPQPGTLRNVLDRYPIRLKAETPDADTSSNKRRKRPLQPPGLDASSVMSVSSRSSQDDAMPQTIHTWFEEVADVVSKGDWENSLHNDKDIGDYRLESSREVAVLLESNL
jgi:hypothetical protein